MGGDLGPAAAVAGSVEVALSGVAELILVGDERAVRAHLPPAGAPAGLSVLDAPDVVEGHERGARAFRRRPHSSLGVAMKLAARGAVDAVVSPGHTGAVVVAGTVLLGRMDGIERPALLVTVPGVRGDVALLDVGANVSVKPAHLLQFGAMGAAWAHAGMGRAQPRVGLLSNGSEPSRGNDVIRAAHALLSHSLEGYVGPVEGMDLFGEHIDVAVCDGLTGNILLKGMEGAVERTLGLVFEALSAPGVGVASPELRATLRRVMGRVDYAEQGGALLCGLQQVVVVAHGRSDARALENAIRLAVRSVEGGMTARLHEGLAALRPVA